MYREVRFKLANEEQVDEENMTVGKKNKNYMWLLTLSV
jgi:hypothetical protein